MWETAGTIWLAQIRWETIWLAQIWWATIQPAQMGRKAFSFAQIRGLMFGSAQIRLCQTVSNRPIDGDHSRIKGQRLVY